jgi:hypothetical protein
VSRTGWILVLAVVLVAGACAGDDDAAVPPSDTAGDEPSGPPSDASGTATPGTDAAPPRGDTTTVYERGVIDPGLAPFVRRATDDLAGRLGVDAAEIELLTAVLVSWPDASLGCPQPGFEYAQVLTDGSVIELGVDDRVYRYHSGGTRTPFLCDQPLDRPPPSLPLP